jgi:Uma2 family endonuclease
MEIISYDSQERDRQEKYQEYQAAGVREYWLIAPLTQRIDVYCLITEGRYEPLTPESGGYRSAVIPGFFINPQWLWGRPVRPQHS